MKIFGIPVEAELAGQMIYIVNDDAPGFIGALGTRLGENGINIATFNLGRREEGGEAVALVAVDDPITPERRRRSCAQLPGVREVVPLSFLAYAKRAPRFGAPLAGPPACEWAELESLVGAVAVGVGPVADRVSRRSSPSAAHLRRPHSRRWPVIWSAALSTFASICVGGVLGIRFDIVGRLLVRALVAGRERAKAEGDRKDGGGLHLSFPCRVFFGPGTGT